MGLGEWLRGLGLGQYETSFRENGVDAEVLPDLTDADLEKLGDLGHRKRLLKAIAGLKSAAAEPVSGQQAAKPEPKPHDAECLHLKSCSAPLGLDSDVGAA